MSSPSVASFVNQAPRAVNGLLRSHDLFKEVFRWDQHLNVLSFRDSRVGGRKQANQALLELTRMTGGTYCHVADFASLRQRIEIIAHSTTNVVIKIDQVPVRFFYNLAAKIKKSPIS